MRQEARRFFTYGLIIPLAIALAGCADNVVASSQAAQIAAPTPAVLPGEKIIGDMRALGPDAPLLQYYIQQLKPDETVYQCFGDNLTMSLHSYPLYRQNPYAAGATGEATKNPDKPISILDAKGAESLLRRLELDDRFPEEWKVIPRTQLKQMIQNVAILHEPFHRCLSGSQQVNVNDLFTKAAAIGTRIDRSNIASVTTEGFDLVFHPKAGQDVYYHDVEEIAAQAFTAEVVQKSHPDLQVILDHISSPSPDHAVFLRFLDYDHNLLQHMRDFKKQGKLFGEDGLEGEISQRFYYLQMEDLLRSNPNPDQEIVDRIKTQSDKIAEGYVISLLFNHTAFRGVLEEAGYVIVDSQ